MLHGLMMLTAAIAILGGDLQGLLSELALRSETRHSSQIEAAVRASPALAGQLQELAAAGKLTGFETPPASTAPQDGAPPLTGWRSGGTINLSPELLERVATVERRFRTLDYSRNNPNDLVFILGFLASKLDTEAAMAHVRQLMSAEAKQKAAALAPGAAFDVTDFLKRSMEIMAADDARAYLQAVNKVTDAAETSKGAPLSVQEFTQLMMKMRYSEILIKSMQQPGNSLVTPPSLRFALDEHNIKAVAAALLDSAVFDFR